MSDETTVTVTTVLAGLMFLALVGFVVWKARQNRAAAVSKAAPKVAGEDPLEGGARRPEAFEEPSDEDLEMMGDLLGEIE
tara:strand:+ start:24 stop:263 length:240 start_codon:yes stop_codon:yes gene_type:complete